MRQAVEGNGRSAVTVPTMIWSSFSPWMPASRTARRAASVARAEAGVSGSEIRRSLIPVRVVIHSSEVSTIFSKSLFVRTRSGVQEPTPTMWTSRAGSIMPASRSGPSCGLRGELVQILADVVRHARLGAPGRGTDRVLDRARVRAAVRDDACPVHAQKRRPADLGVVHPPLQPPKRRLEQKSGEHAQGIASYFVPDHVAHAGDHALRELEQHVPDEPVAHDDVRGAEDDVAPLDVPDEMDRALLQ